MLSAASRATLRLVVGSAVSTDPTGVVRSPTENVKPPDTGWSSAEITRKLTV